MSLKTVTRRAPLGGIGESVSRPDAVEKLTGQFKYTSDLTAEGCLWGATVRADVVCGQVRNVDVSKALEIEGVELVLLAADIPGDRYCGLDKKDQAVLADRLITYLGEPIALVAGHTRSAARAAAKAIRVEIKKTTAVTDPTLALEHGEVFREVHWSRGDRSIRGEVIVEGTYEVGMQDQAPLGTESGIAIPCDDGSIDIHAATQWTHSDVEQIANSLRIEPAMIRVHAPGIGGAFGAREDVTVQIHTALLAQAARRPVRMVYDRRESFLGHVHRHPALLHYRHESGHDGRLQRVEVRMILDGGAYASTSGFVLGTAGAWATGPYRCPSVKVDGYVARTNNPPAGAMRGFGAVQVCIGYEAQMDKLAERLGIDPIDLRLRNALATGDAMPVTGQVFNGELGVGEALQTIASLPVPSEEIGGTPFGLPGSTGNTVDVARIRRGVGYAVGIKNASFPEGFDDYSEARVAVTAIGFEVTTAAVEVGQGMVTVLEQIARTTLGVESVNIRFGHTTEVGSAGSSSASRQTQVSGGAVLAACQRLLDQLQDAFGTQDLRGDGLYRGGVRVMELDELSRSSEAAATVRFRHPPTEAPNPTGQGNIHAEVMIAAHRAVVDVDIDLGSVRVVEIATVQDVGKVLNHQSLVGQVEGGIAQGLGLATMEELIIEDGRVLNASFTDYLIPTIVDMPRIETVFLENPSEWGPFGAKGAAEAPTVSSPAAVLSAIRNAVGRDLHHVPARPDEIVGIS